MSKRGNTTSYYNGRKNSKNSPYYSNTGGTKVRKSYLEKSKEIYQLYSERKKGV